MNIALLKNYSNKNINIIFFKKKKIIRKVTENKKLFKYLKNEKRGLDWYSKKLKKKFLYKKMFFSKNFSYIDINTYNGKKEVFYKSIIKNAHVIEKSFYHYKKYWPKKKFVNVHGDLTIDNIISGKNYVRFIDWELFQKKKELWGYDLIYLLISSLYFPYKIKKNISNHEKKIFKELWKKLLKLRLPGSLAKNPIKICFDITKKKNWQLIYKDHPKKLIFNNLESDFLNILNKLIITK